MNKINNAAIILLTFFSIHFFGCKKLIEISPPNSTITNGQVFSSNDQATSAVSGMYFGMINQNQGIFSGGSTIFFGMAADELTPFFTSDIDLNQFYRNDLLPNNFYCSQMWSTAFGTLYTANSIIEGMSDYSGVSDSVKNELVGECKFVRAFCNFYLVNYYGPIPLINTTNWRNTGVLGRASMSEVYQHIIDDLKDAQNRLGQNYWVGKGERIIPNKWAAAAFLARVYLFLGQWTNAENQASSVISNSSLYRLNSNLADVFKKNSSEAIWQLKQNNLNFPYNATPEGLSFIPANLNSTTPPFAYLDSTLLASFEQSDLRKSFWIDSTIYTPTNVKYFFPGKYKIGQSQAIPNGPYAEYYMVLRIAEQYLIRAEAKAKQNNLNGAIDDVNAIRNRAGLPSLPQNTLTQAQVMAAIEQENRIEFFAEWGHRWLDLKRWAKADAVLGPIKGSNWQNTDQLCPIPLGELNSDPNLTQNPGY